MFIEKIDLFADHEKMMLDLNNITNQIGWPRKLNKDGNTISSNQIGLTHRLNIEDQFLDNVGSLYDPEIKNFFASEKDFTEFNDMLGNYTKGKILELCEKENINYGRIRYMRLPEKSGLTVHFDSEVRYHYALQTHPNAFFGEKVNESNLSAKCYHIPADSYFYKVDTRKEHFVYNGSRQDRIHLVICAA